MSLSSKKFAAILVAATAGAGAIAAAPLMAQDDHRGGGHRHPGGSPQQQPRPVQPGAQPGQQAPVIGVVPPDQPREPGATRPGTRSQGPALVPGDGNASPRVAGADTWMTQGTRRGRSFRVSCEFVKQGMFDPIVFPGQDPAGHDHQFFGALGIAPDSTPAALVAANATGTSTSCAQTRDGSAYWMPALRIVDNPDSPITLEPDEMRVRYSAPRGQRVRAFPAGFTAIAGTPMATEPQANVGWRCEYATPGATLQTAPPTCGPEEAIVGVVRFPNCWDGTNVTSPTNPKQDHIAFRSGGTCPTTHPIALPELVAETFWPGDGQAHSYALASGSTIGLHADFMNGWDQRALRNQVRRWLNRRA